ncbi:MFS transporter [Chitinimonas arctica]|uniref:Uncharacterized MFS-type transporter FNU76_03905 n=1 Tax=Chitinimonas arctica TaxID=2594795 RepID=A0A516SBN9_9NEIS|nr:arabinose transporter [Chitinimonas arctica]QDQ25562.1 MFS transporter [Chitinimonas arctica]
MNKAPLASPAAATTAAASPSVFIRLLPITLAVFIVFLTIGLPLPVLPLHVHGTLAMSTLVVGVVIGSQFAAALLSRAWAGGMADTVGAKRTMLVGSCMAACSGLAYLLSDAFSALPAGAVAVLLLGRLLWGCAESLLVTGALSWGVGLLGPQHAGKVMAWVGMAMYGAYALGAPIGVWIYRHYGFTGIAAACTVIPLLALALVATVRPSVLGSVKRVPFYRVLGTVWLPGVGLALSSVGFGVITAFIALLFAARNWGNASMAFTAFGMAFIAARLLFGHLPDKLGGAKVALVSVLIEAVGQLLIWRAEGVMLAYLGAALTGFGYSLAFPGFGVEAIRRAPPESRGVAMGAYVAFLDVALGITGPLAGMIASHHDLDTIYLAGGIAVFCSTAVALSLLVRPAVAIPQTGKGGLQKSPL